MEADASKTTTSDPAAMLGTASAGRAKAKTTAERINSCKSSSRFRLIRCHGEFAWRSRSSICHKRVEEISTSRRRSLSMYRTRIGIPSRAKRNAEGDRKRILFNNSGFTHFLEDQLIPRQCGVDG